MSNLQLLSVDHFQQNATSLIMPNPPLMTSERSGWSSIQLANFIQPAWELPAFYSLQHIIIIAKNRQPVNAELVMEGQLCRVQYHPNDYIDGYIEVFPAGLCSQICWDQEIDFTHFYLDPAFVAQVAHETVDPDRVEIQFEPKRSDALVYQICQALRSDLDTGGSGNGFYGDSMATALAAHLLRRYSTRRLTFREYEDGLSKFKLKQAIEYIHAHLGENLSLAAIADELDMSQYYFCRLFKRSTGISPHQYLIQQRVERAKQLLRQPERTITAIALECGFSNQSHFAKHFGKLVEISPKQFRKQ
ncbi:MAG: AraC family transcriptional regulator [Myxacorys chilensis ATA2-1-KO14]|jgi:AraC family transcriptional regulator|nr:AraC family transcriptional regulator [Myxacorys chilensis ATA2-1-KO14]